MAKIEVKNVKLFKGSGKSATFLEAFEKLPNDSKLRDFISQNYGHGFYTLTYHDGVKPQRKVIVLDRLNSSKSVESGSSYQPTQRDGGADYLYQILKDDIREVKELQRQVLDNQRIIIEMLKDAVEEVEEIHEEEEDESSVLNEILKKVQI